MDHNLVEVMEAFMSVNNKIFQAKDETVVFSNGIELKTGAIHLIEAIGIHPLSNVSTLALKLGVTKGAVSQQIPKLLEKKLVLKTHKLDNQKDFVLELMPAGQIVFQEHAQAHEELYRELSSRLSIFSDNDTQNLIELFKLIGEYVDTYRQGFI